MSRTPCNCPRGGKTYTFIDLTIARMRNSNAEPVRDAPLGLTSSFDKRGPGAYIWRAYRPSFFNILDQQGEVHEQNLDVVFHWHAPARSVAWSRKKAGGTQAAVAALEQQWLESQKTNKPDMVAPLLSEKFVNTGSDGKVTGKAESLASAKATKYDSVAYDDLKVTVVGDTAVATGDFKAKGTVPEGKTLDAHERLPTHGPRFLTGNGSALRVTSRQSKCRNRAADQRPRLVNPVPLGGCGLVGCAP